MATTHIHNTPPSSQTTVHKNYRVEDSGSSALLWVVLALVLLGALAYAFWDRDAGNAGTDVNISTTAPTITERVTERVSDAGVSMREAVTPDTSVEETTGISVDGDGLDVTATERTTTE